MSPWQRGAGPIVVKIGGSTLGEADTTIPDIAALERQGHQPIVVHGGGAEASRWLEAMGIESRFVEGLRVTDERTLPVVVAVFAGIVNKRIVAALNAAGARAAGISGADGRTLECERRRPELGFVGSPVAAHAEVVLALRAAGVVPVISPIGYVAGPEADQLVNVNADEAAAWIAQAVNASALVFLTDVDGVRGADGAVRRKLDVDEVAELRAAGVVAGGMIPKTEACLRAAAMGVRSQIVDGRVPGALLALAGQGTVFEPESS